MSRNYVKTMENGQIFEGVSEFNEYSSFAREFATNNEIIFMGQGTREGDITCACMLRLTCSLTPDYRAELVNFCAFPTSVGIGTKLIKQVKDFCKARPNVKVIELYAERDDDQDRTCKFYERNGFKREILPDYMLGENEVPNDGIRMVFICP